MGEKELGAFARFCTLLGFQLKPGRSVVGPPVAFLGLLGDFPTSANKFPLSTSLPKEKRKHRSNLTGGFLAAGMIIRSCLEILIGKFPLSKTSLYGMFARAQLRPLYQKLNRRVYNARLSAYERSISA